MSNLTILNIKYQHFKYQVSNFQISETEHRNFQVSKLGMLNPNTLTPRPQSNATFQI